MGIDIDWSVTVWTFGVTAVGSLIGLVLLGFTAGQAFRIRQDLHRRAKFAIIVDLLGIEPVTKTVSTRKGSDNVSEVVFEIDPPDAQIFVIRVRVQLKNDGDRSATHALWNVVGPIGRDLQLTGSTDPIIRADREHGTIACLDGTELKASYLYWIQDFVARSHVYQREIQFTCDHDLASHGAPIKIAVNADELYHGEKQVDRDGPTVLVWVRTRRDVVVADPRNAA